MTTLRIHPLQPASSCSKNTSLFHNISHTRHMCVVRHPLPGSLVMITINNKVTVNISIKHNKFSRSHVAVMILGEHWDDCCTSLAHHITVAGSEEGLIGRNVIQWCFILTIKLTNAGFLTLVICFYCQRVS